MHKIKAIIFDWAGTTVDYGCFAPVDAFISAFAHFGMKPTMEETRAPMGMQKRAHIEKMLEGARLAALWKEKQGRAHTRQDIHEIYNRFEPALFEVLHHHADPLPGVLETVAKIREMGIVIGSTTGYTQAMMEVVVPLAKARGYAPDCLVCPEECGGIGRPYPYMLWRNLEKLGVESIHEVLKIGDTAADMQEGKNAGCLCAGVAKGSSMLGLSAEELAKENSDALTALLDTAKRNYKKAGADFVLADIAALPGLIETLNQGKGAEEYV
ncbi:MAG: phosphonoacetaldehyde hydrolase [Oscillospiraceae bacterium]|jgi:phosphonoacetaldehyde hydrolase|nr:phosphonoacetaldehyde hydrolase [Oscillospiraceae bacterium]